MSFTTDLLFTNVGPMLTVCLRAKQIIHFRNDTENIRIIMFFSRIPLCLLHLSTCLTGWVYDQELGLYKLNRVEAPLLNQTPCGSLICTASVDFICWNCAFDIVICMLVFRSKFNVCPVLLNEIAIVLYSDNLVFL